MVAVYGAPTVALFSAVVVIARLSRIFTVKLRCESGPQHWLAFTSKLKVPGVVGVPWKSPLGSIFSPGGRSPPLKLNAKGGAPFLGRNV
jgi:hypothetical protein